MLSTAKLLSKRPFSWDLKKKYVNLRSTLFIKSYNICYRCPQPDSCNAYMCVCVLLLNCWPMKGDN